MKKTKKLKTLLIILSIIAALAIAFAVWTLSKNAKSANEIAETKSDTPVATTTPTVEEKSISDKNSFYEINAKYPLDSRDNAKDIETFVLYNTKQKQEEWKIGGETYNSEKELNKKYPDRPKMTYTYDVSYTTFNSPLHNTVSYVFNTYEFTGGAHGNSTVNTFTFNKDGKLSIDKILNLSENNNDIKLSRILADKILREQKDNTDKDMVMSGLGLAYLKADGKTVDLAKCNCDGFFFGSNFQNFYVTDQGITFLFNQYQVAPGAAGIVRTTLSWDALKPYLINPNF